ncbi:MAG: hypothetical protein C0448_13585 [Sphingobacteriaceae bacterium]|nr:hypothetical protein [Sphingobacteriaceae bacterium]
MTIDQKIALGAIISSIATILISSLINYYFKKFDYKYEYLKKVIDKRLEAYGFLETQIALLKSVVFDDCDRETYHIIFAYGDANLLKNQQPLSTAMAHSMWINHKTTDIMEELNMVFYKTMLETHDKNEDEVIAVGKKYYNQIAKLRIKLENAVRQDLMQLHNFKYFKLVTSDQSKNFDPDNS